MIKRLQQWAVALALSGWASLALAVSDMQGGPAVNGLNLQTPASGIARGQHYIHNVLLWVCGVIFVVVFSVMFYSVYAHRKSKGAKPADFHESTAVEIAWTIVPFVIVVALGAVATGEVIAQKDTSNPDLTVKAVGYQWKWGYEYVKGEGEGIAFLSTLSTPRDQIEGRAPKSETYLNEVDNPLVVPVGKKVRVVTTANDVIHAFYVPRLGVKQDAIPGFVRDTWFKAETPGIYRGNCAELCGKDHAFMPIVVEVKTEQDYRAWVEGKKKEMAAKADDPAKEWTLDELKARGEKVFAANCVACHQATGKGIPGTFPPLDGSQVVLGPQDPQIETVLKGRPNTAMAPWKQLSDVEIAAVITYTRNAWSNKPEDNIVQPKEVAALRGK
ncbi:MAG: cytochrome c oxidase subunit II [Burkholderiaceae bacterium]